ncbi:MAG: cell envelope integrity protein TolA [Gammaproteobacteria bacterium]|nr:cell envelope integrity protein TolA [Gammaproteobacteria bacterium]
MSEKSYRVAFVCAVFFHALLAILLLITFVRSNPIATFENTNNVIKAVAVRESVSNMQQQAQPQPTQPVKELPKPEPKPAIKPLPAPKKPIVVIDKAKELSELKKQLQVERTRVVAAKEKIKAEAQQKNLQSQIALEKKELAEATAQAAQGEVDKYKAQIIQAISSVWIVPDGVDPSLSCELLIHLAPGGNVLDVTITKPSGNAVLDHSAETAVMKASPLPVPEDTILFDKFRTIKLIVHPEGIKTINN